MSKLLRGLNPEQKEAVKHTHGPLLIFAGAGSGKTRVVTHRIGYLIEKSICKPKNILAITFTNKAANEMQQRVRKTVGEAGEEMTICTSHSLGNRILREFSREAALPERFTIASEQQKMILLKSRVRRVTTRQSSVDLGWVGNRISLAKNQGIAPCDYPEDSEKGPLVKRVFEQYEKELAKTGVLDFDDLLLRPLQLIRSNKAVLEKLRKRFAFISVDEYQDTNPLQFDLVRLLANPKNNICAVGDDDQGIYGWRGADIRNIQTFQKSFPKTRVIKLERNYRSTSTILKAANAVIKRNKHRTAKVMIPAAGAGKPIEHFRADDEVDEAEWVGRQVKKLAANGGKHGGMALLFRMNEQSRIYEEEFRRAQIPYRVVGMDSFYDSKEIKDCLSYLRFIANPEDELSLDRVLRVPDRKIPRDALQAVSDHASASDCPLWHAFRKYRTLQIDKEAKHRIGGFVKFMEKAITAFAKRKIAEPFEQLLKGIGYEALLKASCDKKKEFETKWGRVKELLAGMRQFERRNPKAGLVAYLNDLYLLMKERDGEDTRNAVSLLTMHSSKGMEFPAVFLVGLDDEVLPSKRSVEEGHLEEERRLFYVAITRAEKRLFLSWPGTRVVYRKEKAVKPCRFIREIPEELLAAPLGKREKADREKLLTDFFQKMKKKLTVAN